MFNSKKNKRIAELEAGIARLFDVVREIDGVYQMGPPLFTVATTPDVKHLHYWLDRIEAAQKDRALENKIKAVVAESCKPTKKK